MIHKGEYVALVILPPALMKLWLEKMMESLPLDPIMTEIHATRQAHAARFRFDVRRIIADLKLAEQARTEQGWPLVCAPVTSTADQLVANECRKCQ